MQTDSQVSIWVPIIVAIIGIIGIIAGQVVNTVREGRQWNREKEKERDRIAHSDLLDWRKVRLAQYSALSNSIAHFHTSLISMSACNDVSELAEASNNLVQAIDAVPVHVATVQLVAPEQTREAVHRCYMQTRYALANNTYIAQLEPVDPDFDFEEAISKASDLSAKVNILRKEMNDRFRFDLGIPENPTI